MKFLTDTQASIEFVRGLRDWGWEVETVYEHGLENERDDARLVAWARHLNCVFLSLDLFGKEQGVRVNREIRERGGKVISIGGGPDQPVERVIGRLLFHHPDWWPFLGKHDGRVDISDLKNNCKMKSREQLMANMPKHEEARFDAYLERYGESQAAAAEARSATMKRRPKRVSKSQTSLNL